MKTQLNTNFTLLDEKNFFNYTRLNKNFDIVDESFFSYDPPKTTYKLVKKLYKDGKKYDNLDVIYDLLKTESDISKDQIRTLYNTESLENLIGDDKTYFNDKYDKWIIYKKKSDDIYKSIDDIRKGIIDIEEIENEEENKEIYLETTPVIPDIVYQNLPNIFKEIVKPFTKKRERDIMFLSSLVAFSSIFNIKSLYQGEEKYSTLLLHIGAPSASGKATAKHSIEMLDKTYEYKKELSLSTKKGLDNNVHPEYNKNVKQKEFEKLYLNINTSQSALYRQLAINNGKLLLYTWELSTYNNNRGNEWADIKSILLQGSENERIGSLRNTVDIDLQNPQISSITTGNWEDSLKFIESPNDGLFSRYLFYFFSNTFKFEMKSNEINLTDYYKNEIGNKVLDIYKFYDENPKEWFKGVDNETKEFNDYFTLKTDELVLEYGNAASAFVRLGDNFNRILSIISMIRNYEKRFENDNLNYNELFSPKNITYTKTDFNITKEIIKVIFEHNIVLFNNIKKDNDNKIKRDNKLELFDKLPKTFTKTELYKLFEENELSKRSVESFIKRLKDKKMIIKNGYNYTKK